MFDHYLITRFNLRKAGWERTKNNEALLNQSWMDERMWLFSNFCFPSVAAQRNAAFTWLIFFDESTPAHYREPIAFMTASYPHIEAHYIDGMDAFYPQVKQLIAQRSSSKPYIITSRIDNDDAVHRDFIYEVQKQFKQQKYCAIDLVKGYSLQVKPTIMLGKKEHIFNPFISLIEQNVNPKTVWFSDHNMWKKETRVTQIKDKRLWIAVIHEKNKINNFNGYDNVPWESLRECFVLSEEADKIVSEQAISYKKWYKLHLKNKFIVKYKVLSKTIKKALGIYKLK
jgi:hypothetical protein